jgi:AcrR family transcriptional regulator
MAVQTVLQRHLAGEASARATPVDALVVARRHYLRGERLDMQELAGELRISRATLYRWVGGREQLLGEILWSLSEFALKESEEAAGGARGAERILRFYAHMNRLTAGHEPTRRLVQNEPELGLRLLTSNQGVQHQRLIDHLRRMLEAEVEAGHLRLKLDAADLAYVMVRIGESFIWREFITGEEPDVDKAVQVVRVLLT